MSIDAIKARLNQLRGTKGVKANDLLAAYQLKEEIAKSILHHLGFNIVDDPKGLVYVITHIQRLQARAEQSNDRDELAGLVNPVSTEMERILHSLIIFYGSIFYGDNYKDAFVQWDTRYKMLFYLQN